MLTLTLPRLKLFFKPSLYLAAVMRDEGDQTRPSVSVEEPLRVVVLGEIEAFAALRRKAGLAAELTERIAATVQAADVAAIGRNLFEVRFRAPDREALADTVAHIRAAGEAPLLLDGQPYAVRLRLGIAAAPVARTDAIGLIETAEEALESARATSVDPVVLPAVAADDAALMQEMYAAIERDEFFLQYQPKLHVRRQAITSVEALVRWSHPQRGLIMPGDFIPAAERSGAIGPLTLWTLRQVIADQRALRRNGHDLPVFVNIAGVLLSDRGFVDAVLALIAESGARFGFEITETSVIDEPERAVAHLQELANIGVAVAIDDYGAGLSSLAYLKQLPACELKIDKLFVTQLSSSHRDPLIVRSTIDLAHALEMEVVAEGVETPSSLALLSVRGGDVVQGFLISRPLALEALLAFLREERHVTLLERARSPTQRFAAVRARA